RESQLKRSKQVTKMTCASFISLTHFRHISCLLGYHSPALESSFAKVAVPAPSKVPVSSTYISTHSFQPRKTTNGTAQKRRVEGFPLPDYGTRRADRSLHYHAPRQRGG